MTRFRSLALTALLVVGLVGAGVAPAAADHPGSEDDTIDTLVEPEDDGIVATAMAVAASLGERADYRAASLNPFSDQPDAETMANDTTETFNQHSGTLVEWANTRDVAGWMAHHSDRSNGVDVVEVTFTDAEDNEAVRYVVADYNATSDEYDSVEMTTSTDYAVDSTVTLESRPSENAAGELETFVEEYAEPNDDPPRSYMRSQAAKYYGDVESPLIPDVDVSNLLGLN